MRVEQATEATFESLTSQGTVVVAFYMSASSGYADIEPRKEPPPQGSGFGFREPKGPRRTSEIRRALKAAAWKHSRKLRVVFVEYEDCKSMCGRLGVLAFATFWIVKDGVRLAELHGMTEGGHPKSYSLAKEYFSQWLNENLPASL